MSIYYHQPLPIISAFNDVTKLLEASRRARDLLTKAQGTTEGDYKKECEAELRYHSLLPDQALFRNGQDLLEQLRARRSFLREFRIWSKRLERNERWGGK